MSPNSFLPPRPKLTIPRILVLVWLTTVGLTALTIWYATRVLPPEFPLFFSLPSGTQEQLATIGDLYYVSAGVIAIATINCLASFLLSAKYAILSNILTSAQVVVSLVFLLSVFQVISLIT